MDEAQTHIWNRALPAAHHVALCDLYHLRRFLVASKGRRELYFAMVDAFHMTLKKAPCGSSDQLLLKATALALGGDRTFLSFVTHHGGTEEARDPPGAAMRAVMRIEAELLTMIEGHTRASGGTSSGVEEAGVTEVRPARGPSSSMHPLGRAPSIGEVAPDFEAETTQGRLRFHDWIGDSWAMLFSHPGDFTPVSMTELGHVANIQSEFERRNVKIIGLSVDSVDNHLKWAADIEETQGAAPNYPVIGDADCNVSRLYGMLPVDSGETTEGASTDKRTVRNVFIIGPDKEIKLRLVYPMTTGRNFDEILRVIDSLQLTASHKVATPVNWRPGEDVIIAGSVSDEQAKEIYPDGWESPKPYIRIVPRPAD